MAQRTYTTISAVSLIVFMAVGCGVEGPAQPEGGDVREVTYEIQGAGQVARVTSSDAHTATMLPDEASLAALPALPDGVSLDDLTEVEPGVFLARDLVVSDKAGPALVISPTPTSLDSGDDDGDEDGDDEDEDDCDPESKYMAYQLDEKTGNVDLESALFDWSDKLYAEHKVTSCDDGDDILSNLYFLSSLGGSDKAKLFISALLHVNGKFAGLVIQQDNALKLSIGKNMKTLCDDGKVLVELSPMHSIGYKKANTQVATSLKVEVPCWDGLSTDELGGGE